MSSKTSLRFIGSPPVKTKMGMCMSAIWSISALPSALESSSGWAMGWAAARQCLQARSQDCVTSQMARKGVSSKLSPPRAGMLCIGSIRPPAESQQNRSCPDGEYGSCTGDERLGFLKKTWALPKKSGSASEEESRSKSAKTVLGPIKSRSSVVPGHHDSGLEEQVSCGAGCDLYHFS